MHSQWYITQDEKRLGPMPLETVHDMLVAGQIGPNAWFSRDDVVWSDNDEFLRNWPDPRKAGVVGADLIPVTPLAEPEVPENDASTAMADDAAQQPVQEVRAPIIERDAILILGRRRAGKTIYLATLYNTLWKSVRGLTMKALSGPAHELLMSIVDQLRRGEWPEATLGTRQLEFLLDDGARRRLLVAFDYSGEDFRRAFVEEDTKPPQVKKLLNYVDRAAAVILLLDPAVAASGKHSEVVDDDFGMVQAVERIRNWQGGHRVPVAIALTKADRNKGLIQSHGTAPEFVLRHYPALARTLQRVAVFPVSAVQEVPDGNGATLPNRDSIPINIDLPLVNCLESLKQTERNDRRRAARRSAEAAQQESYRLEHEAYVRGNRRLAVIMACVLVLSLCAMAVLYMVMTR